MNSMPHSSLATRSTHDQLSIHSPLIFMKFASITTNWINIKKYLPPTLGGLEKRKARSICWTEKHSFTGVRRGSQVQGYSSTRFFIVPINELATDKHYKCNSDASPFTVTGLFDQPYLIAQQSHFK